jgi:hypothetical protein
MRVGGYERQGTQKIEYPGDKGEAAQEAAAE